MRDTASRPDAASAGKDACPVRVREAREDDLPALERALEEHFLFEETHPSRTVFRRNVYPTPQTLRQALATGSLHVAVLPADAGGEGEIAGFILSNTDQPPEYAAVAWPGRADGDGTVDGTGGNATGDSDGGNTKDPDPALVIHLLMVRPSFAGRGVGGTLVLAMCDRAARMGLARVRLDTGLQNTPAFGLYRKLGFVLAGAGAMAVGGAIAHRDHLFLQKDLD